MAAKPLLDATVVEDSEGDRSLADSAGTDESDRGEVSREINDLLDQLVPSKEDPRWRWRRFSGYAIYKYQLLDPPVVKIADLT